MAINRIRVFAALVSLAFPAAVSAQDVADASWDGYRATTSVSLPFADIARTAVVRIEATYVRQSETTLRALTTVTTAEEPVVTSHATLDSDRRAMQVETCRRQGLAICPILSVDGSGSGFIDNGHDLYTCRHVVGDWPLAASLLNNVPIGGIVPPMVVRDADGGMIYNSAYSHDAVRFSFLNDDPRLDSEAILRYRALGGRPLPKTDVDYPQTLPYLLKASDFVAMRADGDLIPPRELHAGGPLSEGEVLYLSGYPTRTDLLPKRFDGAPDKLLVSSVLTTEALGRSLPLIMARGLQRPGGSGGLVTNAAGEVVGISCFADAVNAYAFSFDATAQQDYWAQMRTAEFADVFATAPVEAAARD